MHYRLVSILGQFRNAPAQQLDRPEILDVCRHVKHTWRSCLLDPVAIIHLFLDQILRGNTAINHLVRISGLTFTGSAYCQARAACPWRCSRSCSAASPSGSSPRSTRPGNGTATACSSPTARASPCPTCPNSRSTSASPASSSPAAASPWPISWRCSTSARGCSSRSLPPRCAPTTCPAWHGSIPGSAPVTCCWATAASARSPTWRCWRRGECTASSGSISARSSISRRIGPMPDRGRRTARRGGPVRVGCVGWA